MFVFGLRPVSRPREPPLYHPPVPQTCPARAPGEVPLVSAPPKPHALTVDSDEIPVELKDLAQCVVWRYQPDDDHAKWTKVPLNARAALGGRIKNASSTKPATWGTFADASAAYERHPPAAGDVPMPSDPNEVGHDGLDGVGLVLTPENNVTGVDLDHALNADGKPRPWAVPILERFAGTYIERSPSGTGLRIFCYGKKPSPELSKVGNVEIYDGRAKNGAQGGRYLTVTGHRYGDARDLKDQQDAVTWLYQTYLVEPKEKAKAERRQDKTAPRGETATPSLDDAALLERMFGSKSGAAIRVLWGGDTSEHASESEANLALASHLLWWCNYDAARADRLFRLSGLMRPKWDEGRGGETYGGLTLARAGEGKGPGDGYAPNADKADDGDGKGGREERSQLEILTDLALEHTLTFFHADDVAYATVEKADHLEHYRVDSKKYRAFLIRAFYEDQHRAPNGETLGMVVNLLQAKALFDYGAREVFTRTARHEGRLYLDLADGEGRVIEITRDGWHLTKEPPVAFLRHKGMRGLPVPATGGNVTLLRRFVNVTDNDFALLLGFLAACLSQGHPYPLLVLIAEQGSGKSTLARIIKRLIDPSAAPLRSDPREARDLMISATNSLLLAFDNLSSIPTWLSDAFCRLATGGGFATRTLYANEEETIFDAMRPCILTGIDELASRSDLLDRSIILNLLRITPEERVTETELWETFDKAAPRILGGLLDAASAGLRNHPHVKLETLPRMADFAKWVVACESALGLEPGVFMRAYLQNRATANEVALDVSPVPQELRKLVTKHGGAYTGTASDLLTDLDELAADKTKHQKAWPKNARSLGSTLRRLAPNLRETGLELDFIREGNTGRRVVTMKMQNDVTNVTDVTDPEEKPSGTQNGVVTQAVTQNCAPASDVTMSSPEKTRQGRRSDDGDISDNETHVPTGADPDAEEEIRI